MTDSALREKHPDKVRPHMKDGSLVDMGPDPGPGKDWKAQEIDAELATRIKKVKEVPK